MYKNKDILQTSGIYIEKDKLKMIVKYASQQLSSIKDNTILSWISFDTKTGFENNNKHT